jgi:hypothetical protein
MEKHTKNALTRRREQIGMKDAEDRSLLGREVECATYNHTVW